MKTTPTTMGSKISVVLASTLHDPENRLSKLIEGSHQALERLFKSTIVVTTPNTPTKTHALLNSLGIEVHKGGETVLSTYRTALKRAAERNPEHIFHCDFDRILHWVKAYPEELAEATVTHINHDLVLYGRTHRAFQTHPETQTTTEATANRIASHILGFPETRDLISACWRLTPRLAHSLLQLPPNRYGFYIEWPIYAWRKAENPAYIEVEGLEWETPDRYLPEIREKGYKKWLQSFQTPREWKKRVEMLNDFIESTQEQLVTKTN